MVQKLKKKLVTTVKYYCIKFIIFIFFKCLLEIATKNVVVFEQRASINRNNYYGKLLRKKKKQREKHVIFTMRNKLLRYNGATCIINVYTHVSTGSRLEGQVVIASGSLSWPLVPIVYRDSWASLSIFKSTIIDVLVGHLTRFTRQLCKEKKTSLLTLWLYVIANCVIGLSFAMTCCSWDLCAFYPLRWTS